jgi:diguanylate cyclase (GGDEF)-like protein
MVIKTGSLSNTDNSQSGNLSNALLAAVLSSAEELVTGHGWLHSVNTLLEELGRITQVSRVWIFQTLELQDDYILQDYVFEWAAAEQYKQIGLPHFNHFKSAINTPEYACLIESRKRGEYQDTITDKLPDSWLKSYLQSQKIQSMLTIPIIVENQWWGTLGLDDCERAMDWSATDITLLRTASFFISSAIVRDNLNTKKSQLDILKKNTVCSTWELDIRRGHLWCTSEILGQMPGMAHNQHFTFRQWLKKIHPDHRRMFFLKARRFIRAEETSFRCDLQLLKNNGEYCWVEISANTEPQQIRQEGVIAGVFWDITKRKEEEVRLAFEATTDPLTGVMNRRKIELEVAAHLAALRTDNQVFSLAIADIDFFKQVNDTYGHAVGDKVLQHFTDVCQQSFRSEDCLSRIGGEEFVILLPGAAEKAAFSICNRLRELLKENPYYYNNEPIAYSVSIGCTTLRDRKLHVDEVFERADSALYQAKNTGRDKVVIS